MSTNGTRLTSTQAWVLALTSAASLMVSLDTQVVATALPVIRLQLHASLAELEWTVNAYTLTFAVLLLTGAALGERLGRRRMLATGVGLFTVASAGCALAQNATILVAARAVQGAGAALMLPLALALLSAAFPPQRRAWALGIFSSVTGIAVLAGPVVGGAVAQGLDWPWIFWLNVPIGLVMIPLILARIPAAERSRASLDPIGLLLAATSALGIVWALIRANTLGWTSPEIPATLAAGIVLGAAFIGWELRVADPMVPLRLFRSRPIAAGNAATFSVFALLMAMVFFMAQFLETGLPYWHLVPPLLLAGCGVSMAIPATMSAVMTAVPPAAIGQASGTLNTLRQLGGVFGVAICAAVFAARGHYASPATFVAGFGPAMAACAGLALLGAAASLVIPGRRQAPASAVAVQPVQNHAPKIEIRR